MKSLAIFILTIVLFSTIYGQTNDYAKYVNPFIGTGGHGHTFPGATMPFGMVQLSPDTRIDNWDGSSGYHYSDDIIYGFSHTHLSGTGIPDGCDILFMPTVGVPQFVAKEGDKSVNGYASKFSHSNEKAEPGYYSVKLDDDEILAEITATARVGFHRYTFRENEPPGILFDLNWRDKMVDGKFTITANRLGIQGFRQSSSWAKNQKVYFVVEFSSEFDFMPTVEHKNGEIWTTERYTKSDYFPINPIRAAFRFKNVQSRQVMVKVAISYVSIEGARKNLEAELPHWDFDKVRADAKAAWNKELSKIEVSGGSEEQTTNFYTALYHTMIQPNVFNDVDGQYRGHDGKTHNINDRDAETQRGQEAKTNGFKNSPPQRLGGEKSASQYTVFSLWDTFRAAHPLYTIIDQKRTVDFINTFIRQYEQGGRLPVWELWGEETDTMIGYHAVSVIADATAKGIKGFDYEKAYEAAKHSAELDQFGLAAYKKRGYISMEDENESVSKTLEYAYNDYCVATIAQAIMREKLKEPAKYKTYADAQLDSESEYFFNRSLFYRNLFDTETGFMRPRRNGGFVAPFAPNEVTFHFTEGNSWQYSFFAPHDVNGLVDLYGSRAAFAAKLDQLFTTGDSLIGREQPDITGLIGQYAHGNEPSHHIAYLYNYAGQPSKTQKYVRKILSEFYKNTPDGLIGNEDCGQMSAWYLLSSLGFYEVNPSRPMYDIGSPIFREAKIHLENGKTFTVKAANVSPQNIYVKSVKLNGRPLRQTNFMHHELMNGGTLEFEMTDAPVSDWFTDFSISSVGGVFVAVPVITAGSPVFDETTEIAISSLSPDSKVYYSIDGGAEAEFTKPFTIDKTSTVTAFAKNSLGKKSIAVQSIFRKRPNNWTVNIASKYSRQYTGGGDGGLIDGIRGTVNFASGEWQGYQGQNLVATIDLQKQTLIKTVGGGFLQNAGSWIWMPTDISVEVSDDNKHFVKIADIKTDVATTDMKPQIRDFVEAVAPTKTRYVKLTAKNLGKLPAWHPGAGFDAYIFVDEIIIE